MDKLGKIVRQAREKKGETIKDLAKKLDCSEAFAATIETHKHVSISPRLINGLKKHYRANSKEIERAAESRNKFGKKWQSQYRKKAA